MNTTNIVRNTASAVAVVVTLAAGISTASAYQQYDNASIRVTNGQASDPAALASAFCAGKGFKGAESYTLASFEQNGAKAGAVFAWVRCTLVAGVTPRDATGGAFGGSGRIYPNQEVKNALGDAIDRARIGNSIGNGHQVGGGGGSGGISIGNPGLNSGGSGGGSTPILCCK